MPRPGRRWSQERRAPRCVARPRSLAHLDLVALDQRVREEALAHAFDLAAGFLRARGLHVEVDDAPDACLLDGEPELPQRALDRLSLGIEDPGLGANED